MKAPTAKAPVGKALAKQRVPPKPHTKKAVQPLIEEDSAIAEDNVLFLGGDFTLVTVKEEDEDLNLGDYSEEEEDNFEEDNITKVQVSIPALALILVTRPPLVIRPLPATKMPPAMLGTLSPSSKKQKMSLGRGPTL